MARKSHRPLKKVTLNLYEEDWEALGRYYPTIGPSAALRALASKHVSELRTTRTDGLEINLSPRELENVLD